MPFYRYVAFVVFFSTWINAREIFADLPETSAGWTKSKPEESRKKWTGETFFVNVTCAARNWTQFLRRFLKTIRKWFRMHPTEVKFASCLANYFDIKIPVWRRSEQFERGRDETISKRQRYKRKAENDKKSSVSASEIIEITSIRNVASLLSNYYRIISKQFSLYGDWIAKNHLAMCAWNYFVRKFWNWVDSAPSD